MFTKIRDKRSKPKRYVSNRVLTRFEEFSLGDSVIKEKIIARPRHHS